MITKYLLPLLFATSLVAEESTLEKFGALVIRLHQGTESLYVNIPAHTWAETEEQREYLDDGYFVKAMKELHGKPVYRIQMRKSRITDSGLDALAQFPNLKKLEISNSKITDQGIKKIVAFPTHDMACTLLNTRCISTSSIERAKNWGVNIGSEQKNRKPKKMPQLQFFRHNVRSRHYLEPVNSLY